MPSWCNELRTRPGVGSAPVRHGDPVSGEAGDGGRSDLAPSRSPLGPGRAARGRANLSYFPLKNPK